MKKLIFSMAVVALTAMSSCSKGDSHDYDAPDSSVHIPSSDNLNTAIPLLKYSFRGVWTVDQSAADTTDVIVATRDENSHPGNYLEFYGFPFKAIFQKIAPEVRVAKITSSLSDGGPMPADETLLFHTILSLGDNNCMEVGLAQYLTCVGLSQSVIYLEFQYSSFTPLRYLPFVVTTDEGKLIAVTAVVSPSFSKAVLNIDGSSFTSSVAVIQLEYKEVSESEEVVKEVKLESEMTLKYTSIKRIEYPFSGN